MKKRTEAGKTRVETAKHLGVTAAAVASWENDRNDPSSDTYVALGNFYGCGVGPLFGEDLGHPDPVIARVLANFPPLSARQKQRIASILTGASDIVSAA